MNQYTLKKSDKKNKKYMIITPDGSTIHFGDDRYQDYTTHKDLLRKRNFLNRFRILINENINDLHSPIFYSTQVLWNKPSLIDSIKDTERRFRIKINYIL